MTGPLRQLPNFLTGVRILLAPLCAWLVLHGDYFPALLVFAAAGGSDALDGWLARRFGLVSRFGEYLDPVADKLLMLASYVTLTVIGVAPLWLTIIVIARDVAIVLGVGLAQMLNLPVKMEPLAVGKASTVVQVGYVALVLLMLSLHNGQPVLMLTAAVITTAFTLMSWFAYGQLLLKAFILGRRPV